MQCATDRRVTAVTAPAIARMVDAAAAQTSAVAKGTEATVTSAAQAQLQRTVLFQSISTMLAQLGMDLLSTPEAAPV